MTFKRTDLEKQKAERLHNDLVRNKAPARFAEEAAALLDKKEQRKRDQALGLVPFACKLNQDLVKQLHERCTKDNVDLNTLVAQLLQQSL